MTHKNDVLEPAQHQHRLVGKTTKSVIKTPSMTHSLTHTFDSRLPLEMSVPISVSQILKRKILIRFFTVFHFQKNVYPNQTHNLTQMNEMACSLNPFFLTSKTVIL